MDRKKLKRTKNREYLNLVDNLLAYESRIPRETIKVLADELSVRRQNYYINNNVKGYPGRRT